MTIRHSLLDKICLTVDQTLRALANNPQTVDGEYPAKHLDEATLDEAQQKQVAALMRVNHAGEICAQALYHGQALVSRDAQIKTHLQQAALEEGNHLNWCKRRLDELNSHTSYLNAFWYMGSFGIGMIAGIMGDRWSLGFVGETERQVVTHLQKHLQQLPLTDQRSLTILQQMEEDEASHRDQALYAGAHELPEFVKKMMAATSKIMVTIAYWI